MTQGANLCADIPGGNFRNVDGLIHLQFFLLQIIAPLLQFMLRHFQLSFTPAQVFALFILFLLCGPQDFNAALIFVRKTRLTLLQYRLFTLNILKFFPHIFTTCLGVAQGFTCSIEPGTKLLFRRTHGIKLSAFARNGMLHLLHIVFACITLLLQFMQALAIFLLLGVNLVDFSACLLLVAGLIFALLPGQC